MSSSKKLTYKGTLRQVFISIGWRQSQSCWYFGPSSVGGVWGSGPQTDKYLPQSPFTGQFFSLPSMTLTFPRCKICEATRVSYFCKPIQRVICVKIQIPFRITEQHSSNEYFYILVILSLCNSKVQTLQKSWNILEYYMSHLEIT